MIKDGRDEALETVMLDIDKKFGKGSIMQLGEGIAQKVDAISTQCLSLDIALGIGGVPRSRVTEIYGPESCLAEESLVKCNTVNDKGEVSTKRKWTIKRLYERFHNIDIRGRGNYLREKTKNYGFYIISVDKNKCVFRNKIHDVVKTGQQECFVITTVNGFKSPPATLKHKFMSNNGCFVSLEDLKKGDEVYLHNNTPFKLDKRKSIKYKYVTVKYHPTEVIRKVADKHTNKTYEYCNVKYATLVIEAQINHLSIEEYQKILNTLDKESIIKNYKFVDTKIFDIHHKDFNSLNDTPDNLIVLPRAEHNKIHADLNQDKLRFIVKPDKIVSIQSVGIKETYDIKCYFPHNNYISNNFVVHNSGKTSFCLHVIAEAQKKGGKAAFIDAEHALDIGYAEKLGVNIKDLLLSQPDCGENALEITDMLIRSNALDVIIIDSVAALVPRAELEGEMGDASMAVMARLMSQALRKIIGAVASSKTAVIFTNQLRSKIGIVFGNPEITSGGNALKFYASLRLDIRRIAAIKKGNDVIGNRTRVKVTKSKVSPPFKQVEFDVIYNEGIDRFSDLIDVGTSIDVVKKAGAWYTFGEDRFQGREQFKEALKRNEIAYQVLKTQVMEALSKNPELSNFNMTSTIEDGS